MEPVIDIKLHHNGQFKKCNYVGGTAIVVQQPIDIFSYTVLMEHVKDDLKYTEIGGVYVKKPKKGGWKLVCNDADALEAIDACSNSKEVQFYVDNTVNKDIQPLIQMQPHVTIRPRENIIEESAKKVVKRTFVTTHQLQQQQKKKISKNVQQDEMTPGLLKHRENNSGVEKGNPTAKRKLELEVSKSVEEESSEQKSDSVEGPNLNQYEKDRMKRIKENNYKLEALGVRKIVDGIYSQLHQEHFDRVDQNQDEEDDYIPHDEVESTDSEVTSKRIKVAKSSNNINQGPNTRSRVNATKKADIEYTAATKDTESVQKQGPSLTNPAVVKPTCTKVFGKSTTGEAPGSIQAYLALRQQQENDVAAPTERQHVPESNMEDTNIVVVKKAAPKKLRGKTKMSKVHDRKVNEKVLITVNAESHPIGPDDKTVSELSNFVGTLARDNIPLTYLNWHLVPDELKKKLWEYTLARYILPNESEHWVYSTLNETWRCYKSRMKNKHYNAYMTDQERLQNRPEDIPLEDFNMLIKYWGDKEVQALAAKNASNRNLITETHTMGPKTLAQTREKMKSSDPNLASPSKAKVFLETRKRKEGRNYKSNTETVIKRLSEVQKLINSGKESAADDLVNCQHGSRWLVGRRTKRAAASSTSAGPLTDQYVQELTAKIKRDVQIDMEAKVNRKVQENLTWMLKRLGEANPGLNINIEDVCAVTSSDPDDIDTPLTQGGGN